MSIRQVGEGIVVIDDGGGIGGERYMPPGHEVQPRRVSRELVGAMGAIADERAVQVYALEGAMDRPQSTMSSQ